MKNLTDPKEFKCTDDAPTNNGNGSEERDWEEIRSPGKLRNMYDDGEGIEDEDSMKDIWDDYNPSCNG